MATPNATNVEARAVTHANNKAHTNATSVRALVQYIQSIERRLDTLAQERTNPVAEAPWLQEHDLEAPMVRFPFPLFSVPLSSYAIFGIPTFASIRTKNN